MRTAPLALLSTLLVLAARNPAPAAAQTCNCGLTGQWVVGQQNGAGSAYGSYGVSVTGGGVSWQLTVTGPNGNILQQSYGSEPSYYFIGGTSLVVNYFAGAAQSVLYSLSDTAATTLLSISGDIVPFHPSAHGHFLTYYESGVWHLLRGDNLQDYYDYGFQGSPIWGPADRLMYFYDSGNSFHFVNMELHSEVFVTSPLLAVQITPCGDAFSLISVVDGADHVEMHSIVDGGVLGAVTFPTSVSPTFRTDAAEHYGEWTDGTGVHDLHIADNSGAAPCPNPPPQPTSISISPSHGVAGQPFTVTVGLDRPISYDEASLGILPLNYDGPAYGPGSMGGPWGAASVSAIVLTSPVYGAPDTVHVSVVGTQQSVSGIYVVDPVPPSLAMIYFDSGVLDAGAATGVWCGLDLPALTGGATVAIASSDTALFPVLPSIVVPQGQQYGSVMATAAPLLTDRTVTVTGTYLGVQKQGTLTIRGPHPWYLRSADPCLVGGQVLHLAVGLTSAITPNGFDLAVTSSDTAHVHPATVHVARGQFVRYFDLLTSPVASPTGVTVSTSFNGDAVQFALTLQPPQWFSTNLLPSIDPGSSYYYNSADAINDAGEVVGTVGSNEYVPYVWNDGATLAPPNPGNWYQGEAHAISPNGLVVGQWGGHVFRWDRVNAPVDLYPAGSGTAYAVNDAGHVAGALDATQHAFYYDGTMHDLGTLGGPSSEAHGINASDVVIGWAGTADGHTHAFRSTSGGALQDLGLPAGATDAWAYAVNASGIVVGSAGGPGGSYACLWDGSGAHFLDAASGSAAYALNDSGQVVGVSSNHPAMWSGGTVAYLDTLTGACAWDSYVVPSGINNHGAIVGTDQGESGNFAWVLTLGAPAQTTAVPPAAAEPVRSLGLTVLGANPVRGAVSLRCALPSLGPATLELVDVTGRRVASRALPGDGAVQFVRLDETASLAPGIYFARLSQGAHAQLTRVALIR